MMISQLSQEDQEKIKDHREYYLPEAFTDYDSAEHLAIFYFFNFESYETMFEGYRWYKHCTKLLDARIDAIENKFTQHAAKLKREKIYYELQNLEHEMFHGSCREMLKFWKHHGWVSVHFKPGLKLLAPVAVPPEQAGEPD